MFKNILKGVIFALLAFSLVACHENDDNWHHKKNVNANCHRGMGGGVYCNSH